MDQASMFVIFVLVAVPAFFFLAEHRTRWGLWNFLPPLIFIYTTPLLLRLAGVLPEEITLKKQVAAQRAHLATLTDGAQRKEAMSELARLEMLQAIAEESRRKFLR